jgi:alpha-beta hydrolase superfamily lysophospholipase
MIGEVLAARHEDIRGVTGMRLHVRSWPAVGPTRAAVMIVPGFNSHSGYYQSVAVDLSARGFAAYALDLRGRGLSDGERSYVETFDDYVNDVGSLAAVVKSRTAGAPAFLMGHSAGGVVACLYALEHQAELAGLVCESFALRMPAPDFALFALKGLSRLAPRAHVLHLKNEDFSRDPAILARMNVDPLISDETQPTRTVAEMLHADERLERAFPRIRLPLLILHGTADRATRPDGSRQFFDQAGSTDKTLKLYEGAFHDPLNDLDRDIVIADILTWLEARFPGRATASGF